LVNNTYQFTITPSTNYINYQYFYINNTGNPCFFCEQHPINLNGTCVSQCQGNLTATGQCDACSDN
jgi:hypothetical protein